MDDKSANELFTYVSTSVDGSGSPTLEYANVSVQPTIRIRFSHALSPMAISGNLLFNENSGAAIPYSVKLEEDNKVLAVQPVQSISGFKPFTLIISTGLKSATGIYLKQTVNINLKTGLDPADKFPRIPDEELLTLVQRQTFKYFWDFGHPLSGLARERNTSGETVTSGGSGFGIMAIIVGIHRGFISRSEGRERVKKMVNFLKNKTQRFHGAYPHWLNGSTGAAISFSNRDDGADLVETSYLIQGLLTARQYFNNVGIDESDLRNDINAIYAEVDWNWFRKDGENTLYWHWSPNYYWEMNLKIRGWNECLISYVLATSSTTHAITKATYDNGWADNGAMKNGNTYFGIKLPLGPAGGGPLFFSHYSFLGINPNGLSDNYANYEEQVKAHTLINYNYCLTNSNGYGYSEDSWGLTASDIPNGYAASSPTNDLGVIAPTAAISSMPYTPDKSMKALRFFYYKLGDKMWGNYGFYDAFSFKDSWFASSNLAIDQGPVIIMIENYRSQILWNLFMSCPEVKTGMRDLGFQSPNL